MHICPATAADAHAVAQIHVVVWQAAYRGIVTSDCLDNLNVEPRETYWREAIFSGAPQLLVAWVDQHIVGWLAFGACRDAGATGTDGEIWAIYVAPEHWSSGTGWKLWLAAMEALMSRGFNSVSLWVLAANRRAIGFYRRSALDARAGKEKSVNVGGKPLGELQYATQINHGENVLLTKESVCEPKSPAMQKLQRCTFNSDPSVGRQIHH